MSYHLHIRIFHLKNELTPHYGFSIFGDLYLGPQAFPHIGSSTIRLSSPRRIEWYIFRVKILPPVHYTTALVNANIGLIFQLIDLDKIFKNSKLKPGSMHTLDFELKNVGAHTSDCFDEITWNYLKQI